MNQKLIAKARELGVNFPKFLLPNSTIDLNKWSVVACDQYTSQPDYWKKVEDYVGNSPSSLNIILPEIHLDKPYTDSKIQDINKTMVSYVEDDILREFESGVIYTERLLKNGKVRKGIVISLDLERYDFGTSSKSLIRATEKTVIDRIPPRIKVRNDAVIESPHIIVLIDDKNKTVIEPLGDLVKDDNKLYDFDLMQNGGHIKGWHLSGENPLNKMIDALDSLISPEMYMDKYHMTNNDNIMLFAMGDGNHSLATAKTHWENIKKNLSGEDLIEHPARYALVELNNLHDASLEFEAIHRVIFDVDIDKLLSNMVNNLTGSYYKYFNSEDECMAAQKKVSDQKHLIPFVTQDKYGFVFLNTQNITLTVAAFEVAIKEFIENSEKIEIDYIHGNEAVFELSKKSDKNIGFFLPTMHKDELFFYILHNGTLPKKTFSMGEADEKRYYVECRKIVK